MALVGGNPIGLYIDRYGWQTATVAGIASLPLKLAYQKISDQTRSQFFNKIISPIEYYLGECLTASCDLIQKIKFSLRSSSLAQVLSIKVDPDADLSTHPHYGLTKERFTNSALMKLSEIKTSSRSKLNHVIERINLLIGIIYHPLFSQNHFHAPIINQIFTDCLENLKLNEADMIALGVFPIPVHKDAAYALAIDKMLLRGQFDNALEVIVSSKMSDAQKYLSYRSLAEELFKTEDKKTFETVASLALMTKLGLDAFKWVVETRVIKNKQIDLKKIACTIGFNGSKDCIQNLPPKTFENGMSVLEALELIKKYDPKLDINEILNTSVENQLLMV